MDKRTDENFLNQSDSDDEFFDCVEDQYDENLQKQEVSNSSILTNKVKNVPCNLVPTKTINSNKSISKVNNSLFDLPSELPWLSGEGHCSSDQWNTAALRLGELI